MRVITLRWGLTHLQEERLRAIVSTLVAAASLLAAPAALAAPECVTDVCGSLESSAFSIEERNVLLAVLIFVGFLCLVALLPDFDGTEDGDWDVHGGDDLWRR